MKTAASNSNFSIGTRIRALDWTAIETGLMASGFARLGQVLLREECESLRGLYAESGRFRSRIDMTRYRFGKGEYQYFAYPLPELVAELRGALYVGIAGPATAWMAALGQP